MKKNEKYIFSFVSFSPLKFSQLADN